MRRLLATSALALLGSAGIASGDTFIVVPNASTVEQTRAQAEEPELDLAAAKQRVDRLRASLAATLARKRVVSQVTAALVERSGSDGLIAERLAARRQAVQNAAAVAGLRARADGLRQELAAAREQLERVRAGQLRVASASQVTTASPGAEHLLVGPRFSGDHVFPVGGAPATVSVDAPTAGSSAAAIAAPAGTLVYALADGTVTSTSTSPDGECGFGLTLATADGRTWIYCHLAYLDAAVTPGATLTAGTLVGLVGKTGGVDSPRLGLALEPATSSPQDEEWFRAFAGTGFRWADRPLPSVTATSEEPVAVQLVQPGAPVGTVPASLFVGYAGTQEQLTWLATALEQASRMGLRVGENTLYDSIDPVHTSGSYHYQLYPGTGINRGADISGASEQMAAFYSWAKASFGAKLTELFYDPLGGIKHGNEIGPIGNHSDHVHIAF